MSFSVGRTLLKAPRALAYTPRAATFSTSQLYRKTATETVKDTVKGVDKAVSGKIVDGIEVGHATEQAAAKAKSAAGVSASEAKGKASEVAGQAKGKAAEMKGEVKGKANEVAGEAQRKM